LILLPARGTPHAPAASKPREPRRDDRSQALPSHEAAPGRTHNHTPPRSPPPHCRIADGRIKDACGAAARPGLRPGP